MRKTSFLAIIALTFLATFLPAQTRKAAASRREAEGAGDTVIPKVPRNSPVPQGWVNTRATKDDWEEINFEFNSSIITDGFPTLLWLSDFLRANATPVLLASAASIAAIWWLLRRPGFTAALVNAVGVLGFFKTSKITGTISGPNDPNAATA